MFLLDTDHISLLHRPCAERIRIQARAVEVPPGEIAVSIVTYEEQMRGWLSAIAQVKTVAQQQPRYHELLTMLELYCATPILPFDDTSITVFQDLWLRRIRIGTMDLKIAAIALANDATLLTRNHSDFQKVPGLKVDDWSI